MSVAFPIVVLVQWYLERRMVRRAILQLLEEEKPGRGLIAKHRMVVSEEGLFGDLHGVLNSDVALLVLWRAEMERVSEVL